MKQRKLPSMTAQIVIAVGVGLILGLVLGEQAVHLKIIGDIFLRLIQMSVVVLILGAVVESIGSLDPGELGKLGLRILFWFTVSTLLAAGVGLALGALLQPGSGVSMAPAAPLPTLENRSLQAILLDFFPENIVASMASANMIQVIIFAIPFGAALAARRKKQGESRLLDTLREFNQTILGLVSMMMRLAPVGVAALMAYTAGGVGIRVILPLGKFLLVFALGTLLHLILCGLTAALRCKVNPLRLARKLVNMSVVAFTTTSSAITLPTKMHDSETKLGVSKRISDLVNPLGMTLNSNGLSMYLALACMTIMQFYGISSSLWDLIRVVLLSSLACLGTVVVPGGGLVALTIIVPGLGLPVESVALLAGVDWFSGMFRTVLNVDIDALISMIIAEDVGELNHSILDR